MPSTPIGNNPLFLIHDTNDNDFSCSRFCLTFLIHVNNNLDNETIILSLLQ